MAEFGEGDMNGSGTLIAHVDASTFSFSCRGHDVFDSIAHDVDGVVVHRLGMSSWIMAEDEPGSGTGVSLGKDERGGSGLKLEDHVACKVSKDDVRVVMKIVHQHLDFGVCIGSCCCLNLTYFI